MPTIKVSSACFNELASALEKQGLKIGVNVSEFTVHKDETIVDPVDWRAAVVRKDCIVAASASNSNLPGKELVNLAEKMYNYIITGKA